MQVDRKWVLPMIALLALATAVHGWILTQRKAASVQRVAPVESSADAVTPPAATTSTMPGIDPGD